VGDDDESEEGEEAGPLWRLGNGAILRLRFTGVDFRVGTDSRPVDWVSHEAPDASITIGDKSGGRGSVFLDFGFRGQPLEDL